MKILVLTAIFILSQHTFAAKSDCPEKVETTQSVVKIPSDWQVFSDPNAVHLLSSIGFSEGISDESALLAPDNSSSDKDPIWTFSKSNEIWLVCSYMNSKLRLARKLKAGTKRCTVKYDKLIRTKIHGVDCN